jgi:hypothetical protein
MSPSEPAGTDLLAANLAVLRVRLPGLADLIEAAAAAAVAESAAKKRAAKDGPHLKPVTAASGEPSATLGGLLLHSARDPRLEAARIAASLPPAADTALLLGFGLGYQAEALIDPAAGRELKVLACVADLGLLAEALTLRDLRGLLATEALGFIVGADPEAVVVALDALACRNLSILPLRAEEAAHPEWYAAVRAAAERHAAKETINGNTLKRFGRLWVRNLARNLPLIGSLPGVARLESFFQGFPVLVLAAGPSLDDVLPRLAALRERCLLVCVDTALRSVLRAGIEPDFLVVVDPQYWNWRHLEGLSSPSSILVSESAAWPAVFRFGARATYLCSSLFPLGQAIEARSGAKGRLGAGGSVATTAWDFARLLGASHIYMAGLDLGFPDGETHAKASLFEQRALSAGRRLAPAATSQAAALFSGGATWARSAGGAPLRSDKRMALYAWWFESRLARPASPPTRGLSARSLAIPGLALASIEEVLALPSVRAELDRRLEEAAALRETAEALEGAAAGLSDLMAELRSTREMAAFAAAEAAAARVELGQKRDIGGRLASLDRIDADLLSGQVNDVVGFLLPPLSEIVGERASSLSEGLRRSEELYARVAESAAFHLEALEGSAAGGGALGQA